MIARKHADVPSLGQRLLIGSAASKRVAVLFSSGLDSSILIGRLLAQGLRVWPVLIDCGWHWQAAERRAAGSFLRAIAQPRLENLVVLEMPLADVYGDHWSITGRDVPGAEDPDQQVYLPGHNPLLLVKARLWCGLQDVGQLALGTLAGNPFADATDAFLIPFQRAMDQALSTHVEIVRPLGQFDKQQVMRLGRHLPLELTYSCMAPAGFEHCGACNKCAERQRAFQSIGLADPTHYAAAPQTAAN